MIGKKIPGIFISFSIKVNMQVLWPEFINIVKLSNNKLSITGK
jgi:hypothetical protein